MADPNQTAQKQKGPEPYSAQVLRRVFADKNTLLQQYHDMMGPMECPHGQKILSKVLQDTVGHLDKISEHWKNHDKYQDLDPLEDGVDDDELENDDTEKGEMSPEEEAMLMEEDANAPADPSEVGEIMKTKKLKVKKKAFTKDEAEDVKEDIDEEVKDTEDDEDDPEDEPDESDEDGDEEGDGEEDAEEDLDEAEKEAVMESMDFLKEMSTPMSPWDDERRFKAYHFHKMFDRIGAKALQKAIGSPQSQTGNSPLPNTPRPPQVTEILGVLPPGPGEGHEYRSEEQENSDKNSVSSQLHKLLKDLGGVKKPSEPTEQFHKAMPADLETFVTKRAACKSCSGFMKELSGTKWLRDNHRQKAMSWHKDLEGLLSEQLPTSKTEEESLPDGTEQDSQKENDLAPGLEDGMDLEVSGTMGEKGIKNGQKTKAIKGVNVDHLTKVLEERGKTIDALMGRLGAITQSLNTVH